MDVLNTAATETGEADHGADTYLFLVIEKAAPFGIKLFQMSSEYLAVGRTKYMNVLPIFKQCLAENVWPGYNNERWEIINPPRSELDSLTPNEKVDGDQTV
jgi:hypothetical protein